MDWEEHGMQEMKREDDFECSRHCRIAFEEYLRWRIDSGGGVFELFCPINA
jgi:hypothetical protein